MEPVQKALSGHDHPPVLERYPILFRIISGIRLLVTLREWHVRRGLRRVFRHLPERSRWLDAGCGNGDLLLARSHQRRFELLLGLDPDPGNAHAWRVRTRDVDAVLRERLVFRQERLEDFMTQEPVDLASCITALQYMDAPKALSRLHAMLRPGGILLVYVPLIPRRVLPGYERALRRLTRGTHYDLVRRPAGRNRREVTAMVRSAGFELLELRSAYGPAGRVYHEVFELLLASAGRLPMPLFVLAAAMTAPLIYPPLAVLMLVDYLRPGPDGNGLLIIARRPVAHRQD